ncbi:CYTH and CHAD domain-containing protein [Noviherbaspirillum denitrificans]|uniref:Adenylate cyclase n=1 Tax=Noviherbaspirillum denitrificans TaxID=1968433 RepID=A0A254T9U4_9BURK|nr:CYTH and CHAD domain-containing protein [Noviherbaspirillum denitrificans]OWW18947.1 hypothetical protein AYR66_05070 [Noviherbaspirillum denitrificans]
MEIELKLELDPADSHKLRRHPLIAKLAAGRAQRETQTSIYFDTPDYFLLTHNAGVRVRQTGHRWVQTLKAGGGVTGGLHVRNEWETPVSGPALELRKLAALAEPGSLLHQPATMQRLAALQPVFTVTVQRTTWNLRDGENLIELVLDEGSIRREGTTLPVNEIELELKAGEPGSLYLLALRLLNHVPLRLSNASKAQRGYALCGQVKSGPYRASPLSYGPAPNIETGLREIVLNCLAHIQANEAGVLEGNDAECLHQMRVGVRRLRSALQLFQALAPCPDELRDEIRWLGGKLGAARDWDVLVSTTLGRIGDAGAEYLPAISEVAAAVAREKRAEAGAALRSPRYSCAMMRMFAWATDAQWREGMLPAEAGMLDTPLEAFAQAAIGHSRKQVLKRGKNIRKASAPKLHELRIAAKRNRYAVEFFSSLYRPRRLRRYLDALVALQDELGRRNDLATGCSLLGQLEIWKPEIAAAAGFVRGCLEAEASGRRRKLRNAWKRFCAAGLPRLSSD